MKLEEAIKILRKYQKRIITFEEINQAIEVVLDYTKKLERESEEQIMSEEKLNQCYNDPRPSALVLKEYYNKYKELQAIIDRAIEYIKNHTNEHNCGDIILTDCDADGFELLDILKGKEDK